MEKLVTTFEEACIAQGLDPEKVLPDVTGMVEQDKAAVTAFAKMCIVQRSLNGDWKPDWSNYDQPKYYQWFDVEESEGGASGFSLSCNDCVYDGTYTGLGVRLFYKDRETAKYAGQTFTALYEDMILLPK